MFSFLNNMINDPCFLYLKCYCILHLMVELGLMENMQIDEKCSFDIFEMSIRSSEPKKKLVNKEL